MSINFATLQGLSIPEGVVTKIEDASGRVLWAVQGESNKPIVLQVKKITSDTYAGETTYTGEHFIQLNIHIKTYGTASVTYGGLTKTVTDTSGAETPNSLEVFFGTFHGVTDEVETPESGLLTIEGDYRSVSVGIYFQSKSDIVYCGCITEVVEWGAIKRIYSFRNCAELTSITIPSQVTTIDRYSFEDCTGLTSVTFDDVSGWYVTETMDGDISTGTAIDVTDPSNNATLLTDTYLGYYWYRT